MATNSFSYKIYGFYSLQVLQCMHFMLHYLCMLALLHKCGVFRKSIFKGVEFLVKYMYIIRPITVHSLKKYGMTKHKNQTQLVTRSFVCVFLK